MYSPDQLKLLRVKAVDMVFTEGFTQRRTAEALSVSRQSVVKWCKAFDLGGYEALGLGRRGRRPQEQMALKPWQCATIVNLICDRTPHQLKLPFALWERVAVRQLIQQRFGITLALRTVGEYLRRWNMTPQRPVERAYEKNQKAVDRWLKEEYPAIKERALREGCVILWGDETGVQNGANHGRSYAPRGQTPEVKRVGKKLKVNMISAISNRGLVRFMIYEGKMTQVRFISFLKRVIEAGDQKVFFITDNLKVHHGKKVAAWLPKHESEIELFFIPSYSPELNPDEYLNRDLKKNVHAARVPRTQEELKSNLLSFMRKLQKLPERVQSYFRSSHIAYAL